MQNGELARPWFTTIATALVWGSFVGAVPAAATLVVPFAALFIVPIAVAGAVIGFSAALGASLVVATSWPFIGARQKLGYLVAAVGGFLGCWALIRVFDAVRPNQTALLAELGVAALAGVVAGAFLPTFSRRLATQSRRSIGVAMIATLVATGCSAAACLLAFDASSLGGTSWETAEEACRDTATYGAIVDRVVAYLPAQSTCIYQHGSVETVPRSAPMIMAVIAGIGLVAIALAWVLFAGRDRSRVFETQSVALLSAGITTLVLLTMFGTSLYGAFGPVAAASSP